MRYYCDDKDEGMETTCPECGSDATYDNSGIHCSDPDCPNS